MVIETELNSFTNAILLTLRKVKSNLQHAGFNRFPKVIKSEQRGGSKQEPHRNK